MCHCVLEGEGNSLVPSHPTHKREHVRGMGTRLGGKLTSVNCHTRSMLSVEVTGAALLSYKVSAISECPHSPVDKHV